MRIIECTHGLWVLLFDQLPLTWREPSVIAVVAADYLDLIETQNPVLLRR
jgi:hypothetical protein